MDDRVEKLTISVGLIKDERFQFADTGNTQIKCPKCQMPIEIILTGIPDDLTLSPIVDYKHEWWPEENK